MATVAVFPRPRATSSAEPTRWRRRVLVGVAAAGLVAALIPSWRAWSSSNAEELSRSEVAFEEPGGTTPDSILPEAASEASTSVEEAEVATAQSLEGAQDNRPEPIARGRLVVYAEPWGYVWINGEQVGRSPLRQRLKPGLYTVQVGDTYPEEPKRVRVSSGKTREVLIRREALR